MGSKCLGVLLFFFFAGAGALVFDMSVTRPSDGNPRSFPPPLRSCAIVFFGSGYRGIASLLSAVLLDEHALVHLPSSPT
jgi:hypothetical protein